jgi:hypothetical protein
MHAVKELYIDHIIDMKHSIIVNKNILEPCTWNDSGWILHWLKPRKGWDGTSTSHWWAIMHVMFFSVSSLMGWLEYILTGGDRDLNRLTRKNGPTHHDPFNIKPYNNIYYYKINKYNKLIYLILYTFNYTLIN